MERSRPISHLRMKSKSVLLAVCLAILQGCGQPSSTPPPTAPVDTTEADVWAVVHKRAEGGDVAAQSELARRYASKPGGSEIFPERQDTTALYWWLKAAEQGDVAAQLQLGRLYAEGEVVPKDQIKAAEWLQKSAAQGNPDAQKELGFAYFKGTGVPKDAVKAAEWWRKAAAQGDVAAQLELKNLYAAPSMLPGDAAKWVAWLQQTATQGDPDAQTSLGKAYYSGVGVPKDAAKAVEWWQKAATQGDASAQHLLSAAYHDGIGVRKDDAKSVKWLQKAAAQGNPAWQWELGNAYINGTGVSKDAAKAAEWWQKAAAQGDDGGQLWLGKAYLYGMDGIPKDSRKAVAWLKKAAASGNPEAQGLLGTAYLEGSGVPQDDAKAVEWWQKAATQGDGHSQGALGDAYLSGKGVPQDSVLAYAWSNLAAAHELQYMARVYRDNIIRILSAEELAEAQRLSSNWKVGQGLRREGGAGVDPKPASGGQILTKAGTGTAFLVSKSGMALTANHVVKGCAAVKAEGREGVFKVVTADPTNDIALLQVPGPVIATAALNKAPESLRQGEEIVVFGFPLNSVLSSGGNLTPGIVSALTGLSNNTSQLQITAPIQPGSSGSAVLNKKGEVVGMVTMKISDSAMAKETGQIPQNVNFATNGQTINAFLAANQVEYRTGGFLAFEKSASELADEARKWTLVVECWK